MAKIEEKNIGIIGTGNMGTAIIAGLSSEISPEKIMIYDADTDKMNQTASKFGVRATSFEAECARLSEICILAVKPPMIETVLGNITKSVKDTAVISVAAGIPISLYQKILGDDVPVIRAMPNTPALVKQGMTVMSPGPAIEEETLSLAKEIFSKVGKVLVLPEKLMDAVTGLSGSGPAYVFTFIQALTDGGVKMGIPRESALILAAQTVLGAAEMVLEQDISPMDLRGNVTSPGGTTIDAVHVLEKSGFSGIVMGAVETSALKSKKLGEGK